jgi:hypothetical protein
MDWKRALEQAQRSMTNTYDGVHSGVLDRLGLEHKRSTMELVLPALGIFGAGIAVGAALGIMFAPKRGDELRNDIRHRISDIRDRGAEQFEEARSKGEELIDSARTRTEA